MTEHTLAATIAAIVFWALSNPVIVGFAFLVGIVVFVLFVCDFTGCMRDQSRR